MHRGIVWRLALKAEEVKGGQNGKNRVHPIKRWSTMWIRKRQVKTDGEKEGEEMDRIRFTSGKKREENDGGTERHKWRNEEQKMRGRQEELIEDW